MRLKCTKCGNASTDPFSQLDFDDPEGPFQCAACDSTSVMDLDEESE